MSASLPVDGRTRQHFANSRRLKKPVEFNRVYQNNQTRVKGQYFIVLAFCRFQAVAKSPANDTIRNLVTVARVGVVVSKKVSKLAVRRNRIKRLIREQFRKNSQPADFDFVVIAKPLADKADNQALVKELNSLWKKVQKRCATVSLP